MDGVRRNDSPSTEIWLYSLAADSESSDGQLFCFRNMRVRKDVMVSPSVQGTLPAALGACVSCITFSSAISVAVCAKC